MASATLDSPSIFDKMLGFAHTPGFPKEPPSGKKDDTTHRFYVCEKKDGAKYTLTCQRGTLEEVCAEATARRCAQPGYKLYTGVHVMDVGARCPSWNDQLVLAHKLMRPVSLGAPLAEAQKGVGTLAPPQAPAPQA
jgi:hypothetical protein